MNKHYTKKAHSVTAWLAALFTAVTWPFTILSCTIEDGDQQTASSDSNFNMSSISYSGTWDVEGTTVNNACVQVYPSFFTLTNIPYDVIIGKLFPKALIMYAGNNDNAVNMAYTAVTASDRSTLYNIQPATWHISAVIDGMPRDVSLTFMQVPGNDGDMSWGTLSKNGVLTLILHATQYAVNDGQTVSTSLKITITAKRQAI